MQIFILFKETTLELITVVPARSAETRETRLDENRDRNLVR